MQIRRFAGKPNFWGLQFIQINNKYMYYIYTSLVPLKTGL